MRRPLRFELCVVVLVAAAVLAPGIWSYTLVDPWETHYGEVARTMLRDNDLVHTMWPGTSSGNPNDLEGFRSKPVLMFWMMATSMSALGVADHGGYSGELTASPMTMLAIRLPFVLAAIAGLTLVWWMLARLVSRRLAWLALLVIGTTPMFCLIARQAIPDMPLVACTMGALAMFLMAVEDGDRLATASARRAMLFVVGGFVVIQAVYYAIYFTLAPQLALRGMVLNPAVWLPALMLLFLGALSRDGWIVFRFPLVLVGMIIAAIRNEPIHARRPHQGLWRYLFDDVLAPAERHSPDRYLVRALSFPIVWACRRGWRETNLVADRLLGMAPLVSMRQLYLLGFYFFVGVSLLAKGPPGLVVVGLVATFQVVYFQRWRFLYEGGYELKRGLLLMTAIAVPWHIGMWLKEGPRFVNEYIFTHILDRAGAGVDNSNGTFEYYVDQVGHGMWLWAALVPAALGAVMLRADRATREGRVRFLVAMWAILAMGLFCLVQTKFHHYILPVIPALGVVVAFYLDDLLAGRDRLHWIYAALGVGIVLLITRDLMFEPERWIEMFVFRYDRPWPSNEPYQIDASDGFLALGITATIALVLGATRWRRLGVAALGATGLAICAWSLHAYMPVAAQHWGMRDAVRTYYAQRTIYGHKIVYFGTRQLADEWADRASDAIEFETFIPDTLQVGQPLTLTIQVNRTDDERLVQTELALVGTATAIHGHTVELTLAPGERQRLTPLIEQGQRAAPPPNRVRPPIRAVDADRLIAWQLYWRGEQFWSGGEIWGWLPEQKVSFVHTNNIEFTKYLADRTRAPLGRRYFLITEDNRITSVRGLLPTPRARESFEVLDTSSNKFSLAAFFL